MSIEVSCRRPTFEVLIWMFWLSPLYPLQGQFQNLKFERLEDQLFLKNRFIDFIKRDSYGFIWMSSMEGVYRFDGIDLVTFTPDNSPGMTGKNIQSSFYEDRTGNIWFSSYSALNCFVRAQEKFVSVQLVLNDEVVNSGYCLFHIDKEGNLWTKADEWLARYNIHSKETFQIGTTRGVRFAVDTSDLGEVKRIIACPWLNEPGIERFDFNMKTGKCTKRTVLNRIDEQGETRAPEFSWATIQDDTLIWLFSDYGIIAYDPVKDRTSSSYKIMDKRHELIKKGVFLDNRHLITITKNSGLWLFDTKDRKFERNYSFDDKDPGTISSNSLREVYLDSRDHLWVSHYNQASVNRSWISSNDFVMPGSDNEYNRLSTTSLIEDFDGEIWGATDRHGVLSIKISKTGKLKQKCYLSAPQMSLLRMGPYGQVWGMDKQKLYRLSNDKWIEVYQSAFANNFTFIPIDGERILLSTNAGLSILEYGDRIELNEWHEITNVNNVQVFNAFYSGRGLLLLPNKSKELLIYDTSVDTLSLLEIVQFSGDIYTYWEEENSDMALLGTSKGLFQIHLGSFELSKIELKNNILNSAQIYSVLRDNSGQYWLSTNVGLWVYEPIKNQLFHYTRVDGLPSNEFTLGSNLKSSRGNIWLGTNTGIVSFDPSSISPYPFGPRVQLTSLNINNEKLDSDLSINAMEEIRLSHSQNSLEFHAIGMSSHSPNAVTLMYRLRGNSNEKFSQSGNPAIISYTNLNPGTYELEIYGVNSNGISGDRRNLSIIVKRPVWRRSWFLAVITTIVCSIVYITINRRNLRKQSEAYERRQLIKETLQEERNRIAGEMHDDLGGGLSAIQILLKPIKKESLSDKAQKNVFRIEQYSNQLIESMREIVWALNSRYDNLADLIAFTRRYVASFLDDHSISCTTETLNIVASVSVGGKMRRNIFLIVKESVHNVVKHSRASEVQLSFCNEDGLSISIRDNGVGFDQKNKNMNGSGLLNMKKRVEQINGRIDIISDNGTTVILQIPLNGNIESFLKKESYGR